MLSEQSLKGHIVKLIHAAAVYLPADVKEALRRAYEAEEGLNVRLMLKAILDNIEIAERERRPICQDTGVIMFHVRAGERFSLLGKLPRIFREAAAEATRKIPLRPNAVDIITEKNSGDNTGDHIPWISWEIVPESDEAEITVLLKGGGSEAASMAKVIPPAQGLSGALKVALDSVFEAGPKICPPIFLGVGIGATADIAMNLAKKALLRKAGERNPRAEIAELEGRLLRAVNVLGWGAHGVGGRITALDARIEASHRHPATLAVGVLVGCWAFRYSTLKIAGDDVNFVTHRFLNEEV